MRKSKQLNIRIEEAHLEALKRLAQQDERSLSSYVELLLRRHIADTLGAPPQRSQSKTAPKGKG